jgi:hypothetical protein
VVYASGFATANKPTDAESDKRQDDVKDIELCNEAHRISPLVNDRRRLDHKTKRGTGDREREWYPKGIMFTAEPQERRNTGPEGLPPASHPPIFGICCKKPPARLTPPKLRQFL